MGIPDFDRNLVLPPHLGDPRDRSQLSPYPCSMFDLCMRFCASDERRIILKGLLDFRSLLRSSGFPPNHTFHWIDGSFLEDVEQRENRPPADIDVVTFFGSPDPGFPARVTSIEPVLADHSELKRRFKLDHYFVDWAYNPIGTIENVRYWIGLFSHRRDGIWKGMLRIELGVEVDDTAANDHVTR